MASITIDNLDDRIQDCLRERADKNGRSLEEEILLILQRDTLPAETDQEAADPSKSLGEAIRELFADVGGVELELPPRESAREPPRFE